MFGVGRGGAALGAQVQVPVDAAQQLKDARALGQAAGRPVADAVDREGERVAAIGARFSRGIGGEHGVLNGAVERDLQTQELGGVGGAEIEARARLVRDGVDGAAALDGADIPGTARCGGRGVRGAARGEGLERLLGVAAIAVGSR